MRFALVLAVDSIPTPDGRYLVIKGRLWRSANPALSATERARLTASLMRARRAVGSALRRGDKKDERNARRQVERAKVALGERGPVWWSDGAPDLNRRLVHNTAYGPWYDHVRRSETAIFELLDERAERGSICPSEVARRIDPVRWRAHMQVVRDAARQLARRGLVIITQRGAVLDPDRAFAGPVRISRAR